MKRCVRKKHKRRLIIFLSVLLFMAAGVYCFMIFVMRPVIRTVSQEFIRTFTVDAVNLSVAEVMESNPEYIRLEEVIKDSDGNITAIQSNSAAINSLVRNVTDKAQGHLAEIGEQGINIPLGSLSGIAFLAGRGPDVKIKAIPVGNIDTSFSSEFVAAGINQTLHKFFIDITASITIVIPGAENKITTVTQVLVGESIIIGKVPDVYMGSSSPNISYDLVP